MTKLFDIIERISSRVSVRRMLLLLLAVMLVGVNAWGWTGTDPFNYYYLKHVYWSTQPIGNPANSYVYYDGSSYVLSAANKTPFVKNESLNTLALSFLNNTTFYWLAEEAGNMKKYNTEFLWSKNNVSDGFTLSYSAKEGTKWYTRYLYSNNGSGVWAPRDYNDSQQAYATWTLESSSSNNSITEYYLYNVGTGKFLAFHDDGTGNVKAYTTQTPSFASLVTINKNAVTPIKSNLSGTDYYLYHENGTNKKSLSAFNFTIIPKRIGGVSGYHLQSKNTDYDRLAFASDLYSDVTFERKGNDGNADNNKGLWLFVRPEDVNTYLNKNLPGIPHVPFTLDKNKFNDCKVATFVFGTAVWDDANNRLQLNDNSSSFDTHNNSVVIHFLGIPDKISFDVSVNWGVGGTTDFHLRESVDGVNWSDPIWDKSSSDDESVELHLQTTTRYVKFEYNGRGYGYYKNVEITEFHQFEAEKTEINFGAANVGEHPAQLLAFLHANANASVEVQSLSPLFSVSPNPLPNSGIDKLGIEYCEIIFQPSEASPEQLDENCEGIIRFSDGVQKFDVTAKGIPTNKQVPKFTWNKHSMPYYCSPTNPDTTYYLVDFFESSNSDPSATITFTSSNESIAKVSSDGDTLYIFTKDNVTPEQVTITVTQIPITGWKGQSKEYTFLPRKNVGLSVPFMVTEDIFQGAEIHSKVVRNWEGLSVVNDKGYRWDSESGVKLGGENSSIAPTSWWFDFPATVYEEKYVVFEFTGQPDSLFFQCRTNQEQATADANVAHKPNWYVLTSSDGVNFKQIEHFTYSNSHEYKNVAVSLSPETQFIKLVYQGNFAGYFKDIAVTALDGHFFVKEKSTGKYLSRGGAGRDKVVVDNYGIAVRKTRSSNSGNSKKYTSFQHVDNKNYICEDNEGVLVTNATNRRYFIEAVSEGDYVFSCANNPDDPTTYYLKIDAGNVLVRTTNIAEAAHWSLESLEKHKQAMSDLRDAQVATATTEFGEPVASLARLRERLRSQDYDRDTVYRDWPENAREQYQNGLENASTINPYVKSDLIPGLYCLNIKAFYRIAHNDTAYNAYMHDYDCPVAYVIMQDMSEGGNTATTQIGSLYNFRDIQDNSGNGSDFHIVGENEEGNPQDYYYPNGLTSAKVLLDKNNSYDNDVYLYVREKADGVGEVRFSIQAPSNSNDYNWLCYKNITLTRLYRKEFTFNKAGDWNDGANWGSGVVPESIHKVIIDADATINSADVGAYSVNITGSGSITINPDAALAVGEGGFVGATKDNLVLKANSNGHTGALRLYPGTEAPEATVQLHCKAEWKAGEDAVWQYIGCPVSNPDFNERLFYKCWLYKWNDDGSWTNAGNWNKMELFRGYAFTRDARSVTPPYVFCGKLTEPSKADVKLSLTNYSTGENVFANSWAAPIDITQFEDTDFVKVSKTIYLFDMGNEAYSADVREKEYKGQYNAIAIHTSKWTCSQTILPSMQGFVVQPLDGVSSGAKLNLNYERLVWKNEESASNLPLRAPDRRDSELQSRVCVHLMSADSLADHVFLLEKEGTGFARGYDDGYDAKKMFADGLPAIYTYDTIGKLAVSATDDVLETYLGINTTASTTYTISFSHVIGEGLGLRDLLTDSCVAITDSTTYTFTASANTQNQIRFVVEEYVEPQSWNGGTSIDNVDAGDMRIWQADDLLSVTGAPRCSDVRLYNAEGKLIISEKFNGATTINLSALPKGVYVAMVNETNVKIMR